MGSQRIKLTAYGFCCYWRPSSVRKILSFFSYCLQCHKRLVKVAIISNNQLLRFFSAYKQAGIVHQQLYIQHTPSRLSFGNWVYKSPIYLNQQFFFQIEVNSGRINRSLLHSRFQGRHATLLPTISDHSRQLSARTFSPSATCTAEHQSPSEAGQGGGGQQTKLYTGKLLPGVQPFTLFYTIFDRKGTPFVYLLLANMVPLSHTRSLTVGGRRIGVY